MTSNVFTPVGLDQLLRAARAAGDGAHPTEPGVAEDLRAAELAADAAAWRRMGGAGLGAGLGSSRPLAATLLAASVAVLAVAADQLIDRWADEHLFAAWVGLWAVVFAGVLLLAGTARRLALGITARAQVWMRQWAQARTEARMLELMQGDHRLMADISIVRDRQASLGAAGQAAVRAVARLDVESTPAAAVTEATATEPAYQADAARSANVDAEIGSRRRRSYLMGS